MIINQETGEILQENAMYTLQEIWEFYKTPFIAKREEYYIYIGNEPKKQYAIYKKVKGKISKEKKYLYKNSYTEIYGWNTKCFSIC